MQIALCRQQPRIRTAATMFVLAVGHLLLTSVRRRRQDLAVLKALGFSRRQLMATVASQAVTVAACGIIVGAAVGVTLGSALWRTTADDVGVVSNVTIPLLVLAAVAATVALVSLVGVIPARHAANVPVAPALRAE